MEHASQPFLVVRVENPPDLPLGELLNNMRTWMDHQGVQPIDFKSASRGAGGFCFDIHFRHRAQAALFREAFGSRQLDVLEGVVAAVSAASAEGLLPAAAE